MDLDDVQKQVDVAHRKVRHALWVAYVALALAVAGIVVNGVPLVKMLHDFAARDSRKDDER